MSVNVEQVVREFIDKTVHFSLATASENAPWVCEVHFAYDDNLSRQTYYYHLNSEEVFAEKMAVAKDNQNKLVMSFLTVY